MNNIMIFITFLLITIIAFSVLIGCDDFLSPTIEIFHDTNNSIITKQEQNEKIEEEKINQDDIWQPQN